MGKEKNLFIIDRFKFKEAWYECKYVVAFDGQLELILTRSQLQEGFQLEVQEKSCYSPNMDVPIALFITLKSQGRYPRDLVKHIPPIEQVGTYDPIPNEHGEKLCSLN